MGRNKTRLERLEQTASGGQEKIEVIGVVWGNPETDTVTFAKPLSRRGETMLLKDFERLYPGAICVLVEHEEHDVRTTMGEGEGQLLD